MKPKIKTSLVFKSDSKAYIFFGLVVYIPSGHKWVAMDETGEIYAYTHKPHKAVNTFYSPKGQTDYIGYTVYKGDWTESRLKVKRLKKVRA